METSTLQTVHISRVTGSIQLKKAETREPRDMGSTTNNEVQGVS